jgi:hypothetical protein
MKSNYCGGYFHFTCNNSVQLSFKNEWEHFHELTCMITLPFNASSILNNIIHEDDITPLNKETSRP